MPDTYAAFVDMLDLLAELRREGVVDLTSRVGFTLLNSLFSSIVGEVPGAKTLPTLPVK